MHTRSNRLRLFACSAALLALAFGAADPTTAQDKPKLRFGVGPLQPTATETKKAYEPFFAYVAKSLGRDYDLVATTDWAGISVALANGQVDLAWMGPWGYVLAHDDSGVVPIATVKYDGKPIYHAIVVCKPGLPIKTWPDDGKGKRVSFADVGSTSGWLIPTAWFKTRGIDPKTYFAYSDGATNARRQRDRGRERPGRLRDRLRPQPQRDDRVGQAREGRDGGRVAVRSAAERCDRGPEELRSGASSASASRTGTACTRSSMSRSRCGPASSSRCSAPAARARPRCSAA